jgi:hypothetical protein
MSGLWNVEWLNSNENRRFPLSESATRVDQTGTFTLPDSFLVGLYLPVHAALDVDPARFYLARISVVSTGFSVSIGYDDGSGTPPVVATASIARASLVEYAPYALPGVGDFGDTTGKLVIGRADEIDLQPPGEYTFAPAAGRLDTDCIRPILRGVGSVAVVSGTTTSARFSGDIQLVEGDNVTLTVVGPGQIRIDAANNPDLNQSCRCAAGVAGALPPPLRTINGIPPDAAGNFTLAGGTCITTTPSAGGLSFDNTCGTPCCGCQELEALTAELTHFGQEGATLLAFANDLRGELNQLNAVVLGSRLSDFPCVTCP